MVRLCGLHRLARLKRVDTIRQILSLLMEKEETIQNRKRQKPFFS
jgi:hypothetical protein